MKGSGETGSAAASEVATTDFQRQPKEDVHKPKFKEYKLKCQDERCVLFHIGDVLAVGQETLYGILVTSLHSLGNAGSSGSISGRLSLVV